jgi:acyl-CoA thioesterase-2
MPDVDRAHFLRERPIEYRPVNPRDWVAGENRPAMQQSWFRTVAPLPDDPALHRAVIAYASDSILLGTCTLPHGVTWGMPGFQSASLDHALWLHDEIRADEWLLYSCDAPWAGRARGFNRGSIFTSDGRLVASVAQEGLIRYRPPEA